ncbi:MAG: toll/interleukin-1 receptor domain-containing protein, partial [Planctomycetaceae bacterium]
MANTKFFISYRRELHQQLAADIAISLTEICGTGSVFLDRDPVSLPPGTVWPRQIVNGLSQANAVLALIDDAWFAELRTRNFLSGCWLPWSSSDDWIRFEIYLALKAGKTVIPVLIGPDVVMRADLLSPEIEELADRQQFTLNEEATLSEQLCRLLDFPPDSVSADSSVEHPITDLLGEPELIDQRSSQEIGELWDPETETESPQAKDFKFCISNQTFREKLKLDFLLGCIRGHYPASIKLDDFKSAGEPRKFQHSSSKKGMFLQCSCIVTDGLDTGLPEHVLLS